MTSVEEIYREAKREYLPRFSGHPVAAAELDRSLGEAYMSGTLTSSLAKMMTEHVAQANGIEVIIDEEENKLPKFDATMLPCAE